LRAVTAVTAITHGLFVVTAPDPAPLSVPGVALLIAGGCAALLGLFTTGSAAILAATVAWFWLPVYSQKMGIDAAAALLTMANAVVLALLGPGAISIDAHLFGPREIVFARDTEAPRRPNVEQDEY
jgi:uncharacterized membrane protein YphA (DoxX/SURF4 family)